MRAMTPGRRFKTREAQTLVTAAATRVVATQVAGATPAEVTRVVAILVAAILVVVIRAAVVTDLMGGAVIADGTRRVTKGWSS